MRTVIITIALWFIAAGARAGCSVDADGKLDIQVRRPDLTPDYAASVDCIDKLLAEARERQDGMEEERVDLNREYQQCRNLARADPAAHNAFCAVTYSEIEAFNATVEYYEKVIQDLSEARTQLLPWVGSAPSRDEGRSGALRGLRRAPD